MQKLWTWLRNNGLAITAVTGIVELTRFRGYLILWGGGIHDATHTSRIPA